MTRAGWLPALLLVAGVPAAAEPSPWEGLDRAAWLEFYRRAADLYRAGKLDDAVPVFYAGQLRARVQTTCVEQDPTGGPALLASLNAVLGQKVNEHAGGNPGGWSAAIQSALDWDAAHPDPGAASSRCLKVRDEQRTGLQGLRTQIVRDAEAIRRQRTENGLSNR